MNKFIMIFTIICLTFPLFSEDISITYDTKLNAETRALNDYYNNPFEPELDIYSSKMKNGKFFVFTGIVISAIAGITGTIFQTLGTMETIDPNVSNVFVYTSYAVLPISISMSVFGFFKWEKNSTNYLETLRLQTQYYNLITD